MKKGKPNRPGKSLSGRKGTAEISKKRTENREKSAFVIGGEENIAAGFQPMNPTEALREKAL